MKLALNRCWLTTQATIGKLLIDEVFECFTLEDRYRPPPEPKVPRQTCIPIGEYEVRITHSQRFGVMMPLVLDVPGFQGIRFHPGNTAADTEGCILPGRARELNKVLQSRAAYEQLFQKLQLAVLKGAPIRLTVAVTPHEE